MGYPAGIEAFTNQPTGTVTATSGGGGTATTYTAFTVTAVNPFPVASAATTPATWFRFVDPALPTETMIATTAPGGAGSGQAWTVVRGAEGTTPVNHGTGFIIVQLVSAGTLQQFKQASNAATSPVTITTSTTETVLAAYTPLAFELEAGVTFEAVAFGPLTAHGGSSRGTLGFNLYWAGSTSTGLTPGSSWVIGNGARLASLVTGGNMPVLVGTTLIAGASFDVNGTVTWLTSTTAHANLNVYLAAGIALTTANQTGTTANTASSGGASGAGPVTIPATSGPIILTAVFTANYTVYGLTAVAPVIYRAA